MFSNYYLLKYYNVEKMLSTKKIKKPHISILTKIENFNLLRIGNFKFLSCCLLAENFRTKIPAD